MFPGSSRLTSIEYLCTNGAFLVLIDELDLATDTGECAQRVSNRLQHAAGERIGERYVGLELVLAEKVVLAEANLAVVGSANGLIVPRRPVDPIAGAQHGLGIERVDQPDARRDLDRWRIALIRVGTVDASVDQPADERLSGGRIDPLNPAAPPGFSVRSNATVKLSFSSINPDSCSKRSPKLSVVLVLMRKSSCA